MSIGSVEARKGLNAQGELEHWALLDRFARGLVAPSLKSLGNW
jgi:hypothetical protein